MSVSLQTVRDQAWLAFEARGLPTTRDEDWKYTDLSRISALLGEQWWQAAAATEIDAAAFAIPNLDAYHMIFVNGRFDAEASDLPAGITVSSLEIGRAHV